MERSHHGLFHSVRGFFCDTEAEDERIAAMVDTLSSAENQEDLTGVFGLHANLNTWKLNAGFHIDCFDYAKRVTLPLLIVLYCYACAHNTCTTFSPPSLHCVPQDYADSASGEKGLVPRLLLKGGDGDAGPKLCLGC